MRLAGNHRNPRATSSPRLSACAGAAFACGALLVGMTFQRATADELNRESAAGQVAAPLAADTIVDRIAFGSCLQAGPQPIWQDVLAAHPQLFLMMGDNVYGGFDGASAAPLADAYDAQGWQPEFRAARAAVPMLAIWDDGEYGKNDGGGDFPYKAISAELFHRFWGMQPQRPLEQGIYYSRTYGPPGKSVQIIMLDTRSLRSPLKPKGAAFPYGGRYEPDTDQTKTMLGEAQWAWLEAELAKPADLRIVVSSVQVLAEGHGFERWGNLPLERDRLLRLLAQEPGRVILLSGDRHAGSIYATRSGDREIVEMTASSLNKPRTNPNRDAPIAPLVSDEFPMENFGELAIDWERRTFTLSLVGLGGVDLAERAGTL